MNAYLDQFRRVLESRGLIAPAEIIADGKIHRCDAEGKHGRDDGAYLLHLDGIPAGGVQNHRDGLGWQNWRADIGRRLTPAEEAAHRERVQAMQAQREQEEAQARQAAAARAAKLWERAHEASVDHPYLVRKGIGAHGLHQHDGALLVPVCDVNSGELASVQRIAPDGSKRFLPGGRTRGCAHLLGELPAAPAVLLVGEGYATAASLYEATGHPVACAFHAGNLAPVAGALRKRYPAARLVVCADDDCRTAGNPGMSAARQAAAAVGGVVAVPDFGPDRPEGASDFNDLAQAQGLEAVAACIDVALAAPLAATLPALADGDAQGWPEPEPLARGYGAAAEYPIDALPPILQAAVREVASYVQCPVAMAAASALAALSVAAQGLADVYRDSALRGPMSLYFLVLAESGERKTAIDRMFLDGLREWERQREQELEPQLADYAADCKRWEAEADALKARISAARRDGKPTDRLAEELREHHQQKPVAPRVPRLFYSDFTVEQLASQLSQRWPSAAVVSSEGGSLFGGPGTSSERATYTLARLNELWDGGTIRVDRRSVESFTLRGCRLSACVQVQPDVLREFVARTGRLARGSGFVARFLLLQPASTQGSRQYREPAASMPALAQYGAALVRLLDSTTVDPDNGQLQPARLDFSPEGKRAWVAAHDAIEAELSATGELVHVRDIGSKAAEQIARMAALFHVLDRDAAGDVDAQHVQAATEVVGWHLEEARRVLDALDTPERVRDAMRLSAWLALRTDDGQEVPRRDVQRLGPIREGDRLDAALDHLARAHHVREVTRGRQRIVEVNPELLGGAA